MQTGDGRIVAAGNFSLFLHEGHRGRAGLPASALP
jgi:hypothetical protein